MIRNISTFIGCDNEYKDAQTVVFGAPFDSTTSFRPGTRFASAVMRTESYGLETYSPYQDKDLEDIAVFDGGDLELPFGNSRRSLNLIREFVSAVLSDGKKTCMIGGEHLVTLGAIEGALAHYPDLRIIHFDAHMDMREDYLGETLSHASVLRRIHDLLGDGKIFQFGIRSGEREEFSWAKDHVFTRKFDTQGLSEVITMLKGKPVYFTLDLDVLDPSIFPGTGTPEAGGLSFKALWESILAIASLDIVAWDINELSPHYDQSGASTAVACKILRETLLAFTKASA